MTLILRLIEVDETSQLITWDLPESLPWTLEYNGVTYRQLGYVGNEWIYEADVQVTS